MSDQINTEPVREVGETRRLHQVPNCVSSGSLREGGFKKSENEQK